MFCKDCKFWDRDTYTQPRCARIEWFNGQKIAPSEAMIDATAHDDSGLQCNLFTGPEFGCVKFDPKRQRKGT